MYPLMNIMFGGRLSLAGAYVNNQIARDVR